MNVLFNILIYFCFFMRVSGVLYDRYSGKKVEDAMEKELNLKNTTEVCAIDIKPCTLHEGSRIDGTCNNIKRPSVGSARGPYLRLLTPDYGNDKKHIRMSKQGVPLPSARKVRTRLQTDGRVEDKHMFTVAATHFLEFIGRDVSALNGPRDYLHERKHCCLPQGEADSRCVPIRIPEDDPYLKVTDIRCLNFSRAETFQDAGCTTEIMPAEQINFQTPLIDLSTVYGVDDKALDSVRSYKDGLLKLERDDHSVLQNTSPSPSSTPSSNATNALNNITENLTIPEAAKVFTSIKNASSNDICLRNKLNETNCYMFGFPEVGNYDLRTTTLTVFFMREHNRLAKELHSLNPCWKDDRLFKVARQINIATAANIFLYELLPLFLGYENMVHYNMISDKVKRLKSYFEDEVPLVYTEYEIATRFFHTQLDGRIKRYNENLHYVGEYSISETFYKQDLLEQTKNFEEINRGTFYQNAAKIDDIHDPELSEKFYGELQRAHDIAAIDIQRGRDLGVRGYNDYRHLCGLKPAKKFEDFSDVMDMEKIQALKELYNETDDVELLAGIVSENLIKGAFVGPTLFCIMAKQIFLWRFSDRFWFERGYQFHSLTLAQLHEIRKTNIARLACDNAEGIKYIQPRAFLNVGQGNAPTPCTNIPGPDLRKWEDHNCQRNEETKQDGIKKPDPVNMLIDYSSFFNTLLSYQ